MKKFVLYFLVMLGATWVIDDLLSGFKVGGNILLSRALLALVFSGGIYLVDYIFKSLTKKSLMLYMLIGVLVNFFVIYVASFLVPNFDVSTGTFKQFGLSIANQADQILTLLLSSLVVMLFAAQTKWATSSKSSD